MNSGFADAVDRQLGTFICDHGGGFQSVKLKYTYEIWISRGADLTAQLRILDQAIQEELTIALEAQYEGGSFGICEVAAQRDDRRDGGIGQCTETIVYPTFIRACAHSNGQCDLVCTPITASSMVTFDRDLLKEAKVERMVLGKLNEIMLNDRLVGDNGSIKKVVYTERLPAPSGIAGLQTQAAGEVSTNGFSVGEIAGMALGVALLAVMLFNAVLCWKHWGDNDRLDVKHVRGLDSFDTEAALAGDHVDDTKQTEEYKNALGAEEEDSAGTNSTGEVEDGEAEISRGAAASQKVAEVSGPSISFQVSSPGQGPDGTGSTTTADEGKRSAPGVDISKSNLAMSEDAGGFEISFRR